MALDDFILINAETVPGGKKVATVLGNDGFEHEKTVGEFVDGSGNPVKVSASNPLPVTDAVSEAALISIAAEDFATHAAQTDNSQKTQIVDAAGNQVTVTGNKLDVNAIFSGDIEIGAVELKNGTDDTRAIVTPANALKVDGSAVSQPVTGTFFQATQPVSSASLPLPAGAATSANQQTNAITDAQLRATPVPISGTVAITGGGDATAANQATQITAEQAILAKIIAAPATAALQTQPGVDIGDVTINNAAGVAAVNIQDGGNSITVDGSVTANAGTNLNTSLLLTQSDFDTKIGTPFQAGGSIGNTGFIANAGTNLNTSGLLTQTQLEVELDEKLGDLGQKNMAGSSPVVIASDQASIPVAATLNAETTKVIGTINIASAQTIAAVTAITNALPAGSNVIGHVITDTNSTTAVTGTVATSEVAPTTVFNGKTSVTTAGTRVVLAASTPVKSVTIKALSTNTGFIYVGNSTVAASNGFQLLAGDSISMDIANLNTINIDSSVNGEGVSYIGIN